MRIVYLCADRGIPLCGDKGASVHVRNLAEALSRAGHEVTVACRRYEGENPPPAGVHIAVVPAASEDRHPWLAELMRAERTEVVLERYSLDSGFGLKAARALDVAFLLEVNAPLVDEAVRYRGLDEPEPLRARERWLLKAADGVLVVSEALRRHALASGADSARVWVVPNGVEQARFLTAPDRSVRRRLRLDGQVVVGFVGSLKAWHGVGDLVHAVASLPDSTSLLVIGDGPERAAIEAVIAQARIGDQVRLVGRVPHAQVPSYLAAIDIAAAPYTRQPVFYFSPLKVVEYLAAGLPVVATAQGELPELIGPAGLVVEPGSIASLAAALERLVTDAALRAAMSRLAPTRVADRGWERVVARVEAAAAPRKAA